MRPVTVFSKVFPMLPAVVAAGTLETIVPIAGRAFVIFESPKGLLRLCMLLATLYLQNSLRKEARAF